MNPSATLAVVGGDVRQAYLAALLQESGYCVRTFALDRHPIDGCCAADDLRTCFSGVQAVILPLPVQHGSTLLNAPLTNAVYPLRDVIEAVPPGTIALAGAVPFWLHARAVQNDIRLIDYLSREELAIRNAVPTCEGALQLAIEQTDRTLQDTHCLVIGYGRIGALLAQKLDALGAYVTVSARSSRDFARIETAGLHALDTRHLHGHLSRFSIVFNTVPAPVLDTAALNELPAPCLVIDLASMPGGIETDAPVPPDCHVIHALSLPGKVAPRSAAQAIYNTICTILREEGVLQ